MASRGNSQGRRYLYLTVYEASGQTRDNEILWEPSFTEGYIKVEVRGGGRTLSKESTHYQRVDDHSISWSEEIRLEITEAAEELRIMLSTDKVKGNNDGSKRSTSVVAACGIFINDILDAVPIDKYFELFKPGNSSSGLGGYVRIAMKATSARILSGSSPLSGGGMSPNMSPNMASEIQQRLAAHHQERTGLPGEPPAKKRRHVIPWLLAGTAAAAAFIVLKVVKK